MCLKASCRSLLLPVGLHLSRKIRKAAVRDSKHSVGMELSGKKWDLRPVVLENCENCHKGKGQYMGCEESNPLSVPS